MTRINSFIRCAAFSAFLGLLLASTTHAQITARALGMGGAYTALARGVHAVDWNPANLGLPDNSRFSFSFISVGVGVSNNAFSKNMYDKYLVEGADADNNIYWSQDDIADILGAIPDDGLKLQVNTYIRTFSFSIGHFALSLSTQAGSYLSLDKSLLKIPLSGTEINKAYNLEHMQGSGLGFGAAAISWGQPIPVSFARAFAVGTTVRAIYGGGYADTGESSATIQLMPYGTDLDGSYEAKYAYNGGKLGWGLDLGAAAQLGQGWTVSLGLHNLLGSIPWENNIKTEYGLFSGDSIGVFTDFDKDISDTTWSEEGVPFSSRLPMVLKLGGSFRYGRVVVAADYKQGFKEDAFVSTKPCFSLGTEWKGLSWLPLRAGVTLGGKVGFGTSAGIGLRPGGFVLDLAVMSRGGFTPGTSKGVLVALEMGLDLAPSRK